MKKATLSNRLKNRFGSNTNPNLHTNPGFTIVELLVVIVVIGILAAITIVSYTGITSRAVLASLQSDLTNNAQLLKMYHITYGSYPTAPLTGNCPTAPNADNAYCLKSSSGNTLTYSSSGTTFALTNTNTNGTAYGINNTSSPVALAQPTSCPTGFISVPGSATYGQAGFCVMKYEAKDAGSSVPVSTAAGTPWVNISQTSAITNSANVAGCSGCHLISEAEWMTITQNVLSVASNWNGGVVGTSYIYSGHNDNAPANALAVSNTGDGYSDTGNVSPSNQKRSLTLSNGEVIWDLSGNVWEWTSGTSTTGQPGVTGTGANWREWTAVTNPGTISPNPSASATGIAGASGWNSGNGIGLIYSNTEESGLRGFVRGGTWGYGGGVLTLGLGGAPGAADTTFGFRVSR